jgi:hypothetical protein
MRALAADVKVPIPDPDRAPHLYKLYLVLQKEFDRGDSREGKENVLPPLSELPFSPLGRVGFSDKWRKKLMRLADPYSER